MSIDLMNLGPAGQLRFAGRRSRSVISDAVGAVRYPSPFFDLGSMYLPSSFKTMLRWCRYYFLTNPIINAVVYKMAEYPVTDLIIDEQGENLRDQWDLFFRNTIQLKRTLVEIGLDYGAYGNAFVSLHYPFRKYLKCPVCGYANQVSRQKYTFRDYKFVGECNKCGSHVTFEPKDHYIKSAREIRLIRWNPEYVTIHHNEATGESKYYYTVPGTLSNDVRMSKRHVIESLPQPFIEAIKANKAILFSQDNIYHMKRPTIAQKDKGWGLPMILPVLKDTFYLAILRKAQEAIAVEHAVPLRILFPQTTSGTADPYCVSLDTLIETRDGLKPAAEVVAGDFIKTHTGQWLPVAAAVDRDVENGEDVFEISVASLTAFPFKVSEEHPILTAKRDRTKKFQGYDSIGEPDWVFAKDVEPGDYVCYPQRRMTWDSLELDLAEYIEGRTATERYLYRKMNQQTAEIFEYFEDYGVPSFQYGERFSFLKRKGWSLDDYNNARQAFTGKGAADRIDRYVEVSRDLAYLIGIYAAEGCPKGASALLSLHSNETYIMDRVDTALVALGFEKGSRYFRGNSAQYDIEDVFLGEFLKNVCGEGAQSKRLPRFILEAPTEIAIEAVKAVVEGDGCNFNISTRRVGLKTTSPQLAHGVRSILLSEGLIPCVQKNTPREDEIAVLPYYQLNLNGVQADAALRLFNGEDRGSVRSHCGFVRGDYVYLRVKASDKVESVNVVRGFQVDGDKSFCVAGVATHNTTVNISDWKKTVEQEIMRWRLDNNYIPVMPMPVGQETLGGDGRALMLAQEYRIWVENIISGMGVPLEFIQGGLSYCLDLNSYVQTSNGLVRIKDIVPKSTGTEHTPRGRVATHQGTQSLTAAHNTGNKKAARITTRLGMEASPSHDHKYLVLRKDMSTEWVKVADLEPGDFIAVRPGAELWPEDPPDLRDCKEYADRLFLSMGRIPQEDCTLPDRMTDELARLLGYLVSEGSSSNGKRFSFGQRDEHIMQDFLDCVESVFGYRPNSWDGGSGCLQTEIGRRRAYGFLEATGMGEGAPNKVVPDIILRSPKRYVAQFLLGYFEGDGGASKEPKTTVSCCSVSEELMKQTQLLLLNMGIVSSRYPPYDEQSRWTLQVRSSHVRTYEKEVGFVSERKRQRLNNTGRNFRTGLDERVPYLKEALDRFKDRHVTSGRAWSFEPVAANLTKEEYTATEIADILGVDVTTVYYHINEGRMRINRNLPGVQGRFPTRLVHRDSVEEFFEKFGRGVRRKTPGRAVDGMTYEKLSSSDLSFIRDREPELAERIEFLAETRYIWNEVRTVELFDFEIPMADLTVEEDHSYIADGLVSHNSGSNVSLRMLENHFLDQKADHLHLVNDFIIPKVAAFMGWSKVVGHFKKFKMADDLQRSAFNLQLNQAGKISDHSLLEDTDWDAHQESKKIADEQKRTLENQRTQALGQASIQGEAQLAMSKYQMKAQKAMASMQADPQMLAQQQQEGAEMQQVAGVPGMASPNSAGQMMTAETQMMNQTGAIPPMEMFQEEAQRQQAQNAGIVSGQARRAESGQASPAQESMPEQPMVPLQSPLNADQRSPAGPVQTLVNRIVGMLDQLPANERQGALMHMAQTSPQLLHVVRAALETRSGAHVSSAALPAPEQRPPRRGPESTVA